MMERDPLFFPARMNYGEIQRQKGDPQGSIREQEKVLEQDRQNVYALMLLACAHLTAGEAGKGREALERMRPQDRTNYAVRLLWALLLALVGKPEDARREMDAEVLKWAEVALVGMLASPAEVYAVLGETQQALDWLERQVRIGDEGVEWFQRNPLLARVRQEPRFRQILESIRSRQGHR
jgi:lipopolysaccharide biosynthesis regulator YciM